MFTPTFRFSKWSKPREVTDPAVCKDILTLEETLGAKKYKFGVILGREGQITDDEFFGNGFDDLGVWCENSTLTLRPPRQRAGRRPLTSFWTCSATRSSWTVGGAIEAAST